MLLPSIHNVFGVYDTKTFLGFKQELLMFQVRIKMGKNALFFI